MTSRLESVPPDVLQHIAFFVGSRSLQTALTDLLHLLLTSSSIYNRLSLHACPHLYADIFRATFDTPTPWQDCVVTDSALVAEFLCRRRVIRRVRHGDFSVMGLRQDLWTAMWMILESQGLNESHLFLARFHNYVPMLLRDLKEATIITSRTFEMIALTVWLFSMTISRSEVMNSPLKTRQEILGLIRPFASRVFTRTAVYTPFCLTRPPFDRSIAGSRKLSHVGQSDCTDQHRDDLIVTYAQERNLLCPDPSFAAINIIFAFKEADGVEIPLHLPETRAIANNSQRLGPTMDNFRELQSHLSPLFADRRSVKIAVSNLVCNAAYSIDHKLVFSQAQVHPNDITTLDFSVYPYVPGSLSGLWEGTFLMAGIVPQITATSPPCSSTLADFSCRMPIQCALSEYLYFNPHPPLLSENPENLDALTQLEDDFQNCFEKYGYEKYARSSLSNPSSWRDSDQAHDIIIAGETLEEFAEAWGGFKFKGRILRDGLVVLKRTPKGAGEENLGSWIFEGRLRFGAAFVGRWRSSTSIDGPNLHGIFSLAKRGRA